MTNHTQCKLRKGSTFQTSWIESKFANIGQKIGLKENGVWDEGWLVVEVGSTMPTSAVSTRVNEIKSYRKVLR
jgi:hypothetical protein